MVWRAIALIAGLTLASAVPCSAEYLRRRNENDENSEIVGSDDCPAHPLVSARLPTREPRRPGTDLPGPQRDHRGDLGSRRFNRRAYARGCTAVIGNVEAERHRGKSGRCWIFDRGPVRDAGRARRLYAARFGDRLLHDPTASVC